MALEQLTQVGLPRRASCPHKRWLFPRGHVVSHGAGIEAKPQVVVIWGRRDCAQVLELPEWLRREGQNLRTGRSCREKAQQFLYTLP